MISISSSAEMERVLSSPIDPGLKALLTLRRDQLAAVEGYDLGDLAHFLIVELGDRLCRIVDALRFSPAINVIDGRRWGEPAYEPSWEWIARNDGIFELTYVFSDDGFGWVIFVPDREGVDPTLLSLCRHYAS